MAPCRCPSSRGRFRGRWLSESRNSPRASRQDDLRPKCGVLRHPETVAHARELSRERGLVFRVHLRRDTEGAITRRRFPSQRPPPKTSPSATPVFGGVAGKLYGFDRKHSLPDEPLPIAYRPERHKDWRDLAPSHTEDVRYGGDVWSRFPAKGGKCAVLFAGVAMARLLTIPREYAISTARSSVPGAWTSTPVVTFW